MDAIEIQKELNRNLNNIFEDPVFNTDSHELALHAISILGREYSLAYYGKDSYRITLSYNRDIIEEAVRLLALSPNNNSKQYFQFREMTEHLYKLRDRGRLICDTISKVIENQHAELIKKEKERIEREEEIRAKYRNWR